MNFDTDIIIAGGGLAGPTLALAVAQYGLTSVIIDALPKGTQTHTDFDGRAYSISAAPKNMLSALGIWAALEAHATSIDHILVGDSSHNAVAPFSIHFERAEMDQGELGFIVEDRYFRRALEDLVDQNPKITRLYEERVISHEASQTSVTVALASGKNLKARLLIGADGRGSHTAKRIGAKVQGWSYEQSALVSAISHELPHNNTAYQSFLSEGPLALLPLGEKTSSVIWTQSSNRAKDIHALKDSDYLLMLSSALANILGPIDLIGKRFMYPLSLQLQDRFVGERTALIGDAAHGVHPLAGQGFNLGLKDIAALVEVIVSAQRRGEDYGQIDVLERYQTWRRGDTLLMAGFTDGINHLFSNTNPLLGLCRTLGLEAINQLPFAKQKFMRAAAGFSNDMPKLMTGRPL